jgi:hypothetical protein
MNEMQMIVDSKPRPYSKNVPQTQQQELLRADVHETGTSLCQRQLLA